MKYKVDLHREPEGITVTVPGLPGCISEGNTEQEALVNIKEAIEEYLAVAAEIVRGGEVREVEVTV